MGVCKEKTYSSGKDMQAKFAVLRLYRAHQGQSGIELSASWSAPVHLIAVGVCSSTTCHSLHPANINRRSSFVPPASGQAGETGIYCALCMLPVVRGPLQ